MNHPIHFMLHLVYGFQDQYIVFRKKTPTHVFFYISVENA